MEAIKELSIQLLVESSNGNITNCLTLLDRIQKILETYKRSC